MSFGFAGLVSFRCVVFLVFSYDNFISMVADSMRYVGSTLGLDCVAYTMVQHLCQTNRSFVSDSGLTLEK